MSRKKKKQYYGKSMPVDPRTGHFITEEEYKIVIAEIEKRKKTKFEAEENAKEGYGFKNLGLYVPDELDKSIAAWKETGNHELFMQDAWPHLKSLNQSFAKEYVRDIPDRAKRLFMDGIQTYNHTEWLDDILVEAIIAWKPELMCHFRKFYKTRVMWFHCGKIRKSNRKYVEDADIVLTDFSEENENMLNSSLSRHYRTSDIGQLEFDLHVEGFLKTLSKEQRTLCTILVLNAGENRMTNEILAKHIGISLSTFKRKRKELCKAWIKYDEDI